ncbi:MAG TPA: DUF1559 domain-containing protein [Capsulimonadaceae bacterium]|jgi:prepilin-type N-terminal cleavage/methylation domain-containing protein
MGYRMRRAFTLIELLVVIAIISILAAVLFPVFATAREKARMSSCMSNQKQMGTTLLMYAQDFDEVIPQEAWLTGTYTLFDSLETYYAGRGLAKNPFLACPSDPSPYNTSATGRYLSYVVNAVYWGDSKPGGIGGIFNCPLSTIQEPSGTVWVGDGGPLMVSSAIQNRFQVPCLSNNGLAGCSLVLDTSTDVPKLGDGSTSNPQGAFYGRHSGGLVVDFLDGHTKWLSLQQLATKNSVGNYPYFTTTAD